MLGNTLFPQDLSAAIGSESKDFVVKAGRAKPLTKSIPLILGGIVWTTLISIFMFFLLGPLFQGEEIHFEFNGVPTVAGPDNLKPLLFPALFIGWVLLIGVGMLSRGIY